MNSRTRGALYGVGAYGLWGIFPLYFRLLDRSGATEVVVHRVLWSLVVCLGVVAATRGWQDLRATLAEPRRVLTLGVGAALLA
ncbi:MAG: EamA family transporter RarD, partial [Kineosporiaceae bacterium]